MAVTQQDITTWRAQIADLDAAIAAGVRQVTHGDRTVTYNTTDSLIRARDHVAKLLADGEAKLASRARPRQTLLYQAGRGFL